MVAVIRGWDRLKRQLEKLPHGAEYFRAGQKMLGVDLWYPRNGGGPKCVQVGLVCVRAADDVRIHYDFERDGWVMSQAKREAVDDDGEGQDEEWTEVGFAQAWGSRIDLEA